MQASENKPGFVFLDESSRMKPDQIIVMLEAWIDDAGKSEQAFGGCLATFAEWKKLERKWDDLIAAHSHRGVTWIHAVDLHHGREEFKLFSEPERHELENEIVGILTAHVEAFVCSIIPPGIAQAFEVEGKHKRPLGDPYSQCLGNCFRLALRRYAIPKKQHVVFYVAYNIRKTKIIYEIHARVAENPKYDEWMSGIRTSLDMNPKERLPFQAADFAVYHIAKSWREDNAQSQSKAISKLLHPKFVSRIEIEGSRFVERTIMSRFI